jgi:hypothetical protein
MHIKKLFIRLLSATTLSSVASSAALAHPGHEVANSFHAAIHGEHLLIVLTVVVAIAIGVILKH